MNKNYNLNDITVIFPLYRTPHKLINRFEQYRSLKLIILDQSNDQKLKNRILKKKLKIQKYIQINENIGFSRACNLLFKNVKTKYCLLTQADIKINLKSISKLRKSITKTKNCIIAAPNLNNYKIKSKVKIVKNVIGANFLFDSKKMRNLNFFDENFFLYWEDVDLCNRINKKKYKMIVVSNAKAKHFSSKSSKDDLKTFFIRNINFKFGEYLYQKKNKKLRKLKILRQIITNFINLIINLIKFDYKKSFCNIAYILGIFKFLFK
jgi:N-acetylglucosaminyl-diphospho-decaprenol L-rhamnosyltransferase